MQCAGTDQSNMQGFGAVWGGAGGGDVAEGGIVGEQGGLLSRLPMMDLASNHKHGSRRQSV